MVNVTKSNFVEQSNDFLEHLPTAAFVAIDEEMTGISLPGSRHRPPKDHTPSQLYPTHKLVPERYSIIQLGISLFHAVERNEGREVNRGTGGESGGSPPSRVEWKVRQYNFFMFPPSSNDSVKEVVLNPSAVAFLNQHNMSFDTWTKEGVSYLTGEQASDAVSAYANKERLERQEQPQQTATVQETIRRRVELRVQQDIDFFARTMASLREWLDAAHPPAAQAPQDPTEPTEGTAFLLPACNSFLRRALYESIEKEYPSLILEPHPPNQIRVWRLSETEKILRKEGLRQKRWEGLMQAVGITRIFAALQWVCQGHNFPTESVMFASSYHDVDWDNDRVADAVMPPRQELGTGRKVPIVVHNGYMDLLFLMTHFHEPRLPDSYVDCKSLVRSYFPLIYDTKILSTESLAWNNSTHGVENTSLSNLYQRVVREQNGGRLFESMDLLPGVGSNGEATSQQHEAAFDAFMTGSVFIGLCQQIKDSWADSVRNDDSGQPSHIFDVSVPGLGTLTHLEGAEDDADIQKWYGRNRLYQMSMFTIDLEEVSEDDPLSRGMDKESTYRVSGIDPSVSTRDILRCLNGLVDDFGRRVNFEIVWLSDQGFCVMAKNASELLEGATDSDLKTIQKAHGRIIFEALRGRFRKETIVLLKDHLITLAAEEGSRRAESTSWISRLSAWFGFTSRKRVVDDDADAGPSRKKRRADLR